MDDKMGIFSIFILTSIMITAVLLIPNTAFGEIPPGCHAGLSSILLDVTVDPSFKTTIDTFTTIGFKVTNPQPNGILSCNAEVVFAQIIVNGVVVSGTPDCPFDPTKLPKTFGNK